MPRLVFADIETFKAWSKAHANAEKYDAFLTKRRGELILYPRKATQPITYGYIKLSKDEIKVMSDWIQNELSLALYLVDRLEWNVERGIGVLERTD